MDTFEDVGGGELDFARKVIGTEIGVEDLECCCCEFSIDPKDTEEG